MSKLVGDFEKKYEKQEIGARRSRSQTNLDTFQMFIIAFY